MTTRENVRTIGIVGAGAMGRGIAQVAAAGGMKVRLFDSRPGACEEAIAFVAGMLDRQVEKGRMQAAAAGRAKTNLQGVAAPADFASCDIVVEAIVEDLSAKQALFRQLEEIALESTILATNTSSLSVTEIASVCKFPERVAGLHFFNPVPLMDLVEVVSGLRTAAWVIDTLIDVAERMGKKPVRVEDTPGFLVNHVGRGYGPEALRILSEGIASPAEIDRIMRAAGFRMGPFELFDLTGLDVSQPVTESIYHQFYEDPIYRPSVIGRRRMAAGLLGRKTGQGFYDHSGRSEAAGPEPAVEAPQTRPLWISPTAGEPGRALAAHFAAAGVTLEAGAAPTPQATCLVAPLGADATTTSLAEGLDPRRTIALDLLFASEALVTLMKTPLTEADRLHELAGAFAKAGRPVAIVNDSPGFVAPRIVAMLVNIASAAAQQRIASPADIDLAVKLGLGYPKGPLAWGDAIGAERILAILDGLCDFYRDPRYRASPWLKRRALLGVSLLTPD